MSFSADIEDARLSVLLDVRSPFSYLALGPAAALEESLGLAINWLPLPVPPLKPPSEPGPDDDRGILHRRHRARALAREIETYGAAQGLVLEDPYRDPDPEAANLGWLWVRNRDPAKLLPFLEALFRGYWSLELDVSSLEQVAVRVDGVEGDGAAFRAWAAAEGRATGEALLAELRERGLFGVPGYVVEDEVFIGRQHLPMIRWILEGRSGPVPI
ncbi:MAG: DsbA family protein [Myxococcota bacterium]|nr:DsbA family protein [Myxococcota bacterium]